MATTVTYTNANSMSDFGDFWLAPGPGEPTTIIVGIEAFVLNFTGPTVDEGLRFEDSSWTVTVHGMVGSHVAGGSGHGIAFMAVSGLSKLTVGATGVVFGEAAGVGFIQPTNVTNAGHILGRVGQAIFADTDGTYTIKNSGVLESHAAETLRIEGSGTHTIINSGTMRSNFGVAMHALGSGVEKMTNSGVIEDSLSFGDGNDALTNFAKVGSKILNGQINSEIWMGAGNDIVTGGAFGEVVVDEGGRDTYNLGGGADSFYAAEGTGAGDGFIDTFDGGGGSDTYNAAVATATLIINLDTVARSYSTFLGPVHHAAQTATDRGSGQTGIDRLIGVENVVGGSASDSIFGSAAANMLDGAGGSDVVYGLGGNDSLFGGSGADFLVGGNGRDVLDGGADADRFIYTKISDSTNSLAGRDVIRNYGGGFDKIDFSALSDDLVFIGVDIRFGQSSAGEVRVMTTGSGWLVQLDVGADRKPDLAIEVVDPGHTISWGSGDFVI